MARRMISASRTIENLLKTKKVDKIENWGFWFVDPPNEVSQNYLRDKKTDLMEMPENQRKQYMMDMGILESPLPKEGLNKYKIVCKNCNQMQGTVWAKNTKLEDWRDFHYYQWTDGNEWYGCLTPNVSPVDAKLGIECTCGVDTRDFRGNMTLPGAVAYQKEKENSKGRDFGYPDSKFRVVPLNDLPNIPRSNRLYR